MLGLACLAVQILVSDQAIRAMTGAVAAYAIFGLLVAVRGSHNRAFGLLTLFADTVFFLVLAQFGADQTLWLAAAFYCYLLISTLAQFGTTEVLLVAGVSAVFVSLAHYTRGVFGRTIFVGAVVAVVCSFALKRILARLEAATLAAQKAQAEANSATDTERRRIAADFHDGPLQSFISFQIRLDVLRRILERDLAAGIEELRQIQQLSQSQVRELRAFVRGMRPVDVDASLTASIRRLVDDFQKESGLPVTFVGGAKSIPIAPEISSDVLQIVREALHNVQKHAHAGRVAVAVEQAGTALEISIDDNGAGFPFSGVYTLDELDLLRLGPVSLKRRARAIGAELLLESRPGRGAGLKLKVPL